MRAWRRCASGAWTAPVKVLVCVALVWWALSKAGGLGPMMHEPSAYDAGGPRAGRFWLEFGPIVTAMTCYWGTLALNIPDFTRFARSQKDQILGQVAGLPGPMALMATMSVITTSATVLIFGKAIWDPVALAGDIGGIAVLVGLLVISLDTVSCNIAANLVGPAYDFAALWPEKINYRIGGYITAGIGALIMPWKLMESTQGYIFVWLTGYGALLGPIAGIMISDYWLVRRADLAVYDLYRKDGVYTYARGWNLAAVGAMILGVAPNLPGFLATAAPHLFAGIGEPWRGIYAYAWFVGTIIAAVSYLALMRWSGRRA